jgi:hypothetical protein
LRNVKKLRVFHSSAAANWMNQDSPDVGSIDVTTPTEGVILWLFGDSTMVVNPILNILRIAHQPAMKFEMSNRES